MEPFDLKKWPRFHEASQISIDDSIVDQIHIDSRRIDSRRALFVALKGDETDGHDFVQHAAKLGAKFALVRKGFFLPQNQSGVHLLQVDDPLLAFQEIASCYRMEMPAKVIAITGSYGKTMVKDLLFELIKKSKKSVCSPESFNSQIGVPLSLLHIKKEHEIAIIEAACSKQNEMSLIETMIKPDHVILTPVGKKHQTTLGSHVWEEVSKLILSKSINGFRLLPYDLSLNSYVKNVPVHYWNQTTKELPHAKCFDGEPSKIPFEIEFPDQEPFKGFIRSGFYYFVDLINMAVKAAHLLGISRDDIIEVINLYEPEPWRTEIWKSPQGITFINETYSSDPQSIDKAFKTFEQCAPIARRVFIFGGFKKHVPHGSADLKRVASSLQRSKIDLIYLYGDKDFYPLIEEIKIHAPKTAVLLSNNFEEALEAYKKDAKGEDFVLLKGAKKASLDYLIATFNDSICTNQCVINLAAIKDNIQSIRSKLPLKTRLMVMVKALAYGTDDVRIARFLETCGVDILGVSYVDEGVALKRVGVRQSIFTINAAAYEVAKVVKWGLEVGVSSHEMVEALEMEAKEKNKTVKVHLHVDTGMSRFGCRPEEALELALLIHKMRHVKLEGIMTHFACAESPAQDAFTYGQVRSLNQIIDLIEKEKIPLPWKHAANSSGAIRFHFPEYNMVRIGLAAFGLYSSTAVQKELELRLAVSLVSRIVGINICKEGETISYGRSYKVQKKEQRIAVLPIGYFDGIHRNYSGKGYVMIRGKKAPMVGNICMDFMMIDVSDIPLAKVSDPVLIFGEDDYGHYLSPEELAGLGNSIVYELITCLGPRIQRIFVYEEAHHSTTIR